MERERIRPLVFREAGADDFGFCERLHRENERAGVPANHFTFYEEALRGGRMLVLIAEENGMPVGTCALHWHLPDVVWFCYGLVDPAKHRAGIGTTMFLARIALLPRRMRPLTIGISALETSLPYYARFGFRYAGHADAPDGNSYPNAHLRGVGAGLVDEAAATLEASGVAFRRPSRPIPEAWTVDPSCTDAAFRGGAFLGACGPLQPLPPPTPDWVRKGGGAMTGTGMIRF